MLRFVTDITLFSGEAHEDDDEEDEHDEDAFLASGASCFILRHLSIFLSRFGKRIQDM